VFPDQPRAADGSDPFRADPRPRECAAAHDRRGRTDYVRLRNLRARRSDNPYALREPLTLALNLTNRKGQRFTIYISAARESTIRAYIAEASVCLESFRSKGAPPAADEPVDLGRRLVEAAVTVTGLTQGQLSDRRDTLATTGPATLAAVVLDAGGDLDRIVGDALAVIAAELQAKVDAGELTAAEVAAFDARARLTALANEPGAPLLYDPADLPATRAALGEKLRKDPDSVLIGMRPLARPRRGRVVWYAVDGARRSRRARAADGPHNLTTSHVYIAECRRRAKAWIGVTAGKASVHLWRKSPHFYDVGRRWASSVTGLSSKLIHPSSPGPKRYYDVNVTNLASIASTYSIYGGWERGSGKRCTS
jgi:hypothetical protein